eukprot:2727054-Amphidinium_carterae.1
MHTIGPVDQARSDTTTSVVPTYSEDQLGCSHWELCKPIPLLATSALLQLALGACAYWPGWR